MSRRAQLEGHVAAAPAPLPANAAFGPGPVHGCPWDPALSPGALASGAAPLPRDESECRDPKDVVGREGWKGFGFSAGRAGWESGRGSEAPRLPALRNVLGRG